MKVSEQLYQEYRSALLNGDHRRCAVFVEQLLAAGAPPRVLHIDLFQRSLYDVGELWEQNLISVAIEHVASAITESLLNLVLLRLPVKQRTGRSVAVAGIAPELHQVGAKIVADTFELHGWDSVFIGGNTPVLDLVRFLSATSPNLVALSLTIFSNVVELERALEVIREHDAEQSVILGGQGLNHIGPELARRFSKVSYFKSIHELEQFFLNRKMVCFHDNGTIGKP